MVRLTTLSPHRDDAVFSLCIALSKWSQLGVPIRVVNFFTVSSYAPRMSVVDSGDISATRKREDLRALRAVDPSIEITSLDLLDAPLRLGIGVDSVCKPQALLNSKIDLEAISQRSRGEFGSGLVLAPLGLGNHVDHLLTRMAACSHVSAHRLGFYEDLPYAMWTSSNSVAERVGSTEDSTRTKLKPVIIRIENGISKKRRILAKYQSQITAEYAKVVAQYAGQHDGGERIWVPNHASAWNAIVR